MDHRGGAPGLGAAVFCHPDEVEETQGDGGVHYADFSKLDWYARGLMPRFLRSWDGGPVQVEGTVAEGDDIAGFKVVAFPGHAPGMIGLWRESDRLALVSDTIYTLDPQTGLKGAPRVPHRAFNYNTDQAIASIRKLAAMEPATVWPGHANPVTGRRAGAAGAGGRRGIATLRPGVGFEPTRPAGQRVLSPPCLAISSTRAKSRLRAPQARST